MNAELETLLRSVVNPHSDIDVGALSDRIASMFEPVKKEYTHLEMEAALCVWECINEWTLLPHIAPEMIRTAWIELREGVGSVEMRHQSIVLGKWCLEIYDFLTKHDFNFFDCMSYDWEVIPMMLDYAEDDEGKPIIYAEELPRAHRVAQLIAHRVLFEQYKQGWYHEANKQWCYRELVDDHPRVVERSFLAGENPPVAVKELGEDLDLIDFGLWK